MKKIFCFLIVIMLSLSFFGCNLNKYLKGEKTPQYIIDFEKNNIDSMIACFDEEYTKTSLSIEENESGFSGKVFKAIVSLPSPDNTWWVSGIKFINDNSEANFKNLNKISLKYKSTVDYSNEVPFIIQMVWRDKKTETEVADLWVEFPIEKTSKVKEFSFILESSLIEQLDNLDNYYLHWIMIGLEAGVGELFNKGVFFIDDISFWNSNSF